jgi:hypothetical protein
MPVSVGDTGSKNEGEKGSQRMNPETGHLVRDLDGLVPADKRAEYERLQQEQLKLAQKLLGEKDEVHLSRQQVRRLQRIVEKKEQP